MNATEFGGAVMVIWHSRRKTGLTRYTPVNNAVIDGNIYCTSGFGAKPDWYRNIRADPQVEAWLPAGRWSGVAQDAADLPERVQKFGQVLVARPFAGPLFGVNPKKLPDQDLERLLSDSRLLRIRRISALTGPGGPGDLAWMRPISTVIFFSLAILQRMGKWSGRRRLCAPGRQFGRFDLTKGSSKSNNVD